MSEFDDPDLRRQLARLSGPYPDDNAAFATWQRRVGQAKRRRAVAWTSGAALSLVMVVVGVAALQNPARHPLVAGSSSETSAAATASVETTEASVPTTATTAPEVTATSSTASETAPSIVDVIDTSIPKDETAPDHSATANSGKTPPTVSAPGPATRAPEAALKTFKAVGGSITVRQSGDQVVVVIVKPAAGFTADDNGRSGGEVTVRFRSDVHRSEISVKVSKGIMSPQISEEDQSSGGSVTSKSDDGSHGGDG